MPIIEEVSDSEDAIREPLQADIANPGRGPQVEIIDESDIEEASWFQRLRKNIGSWFSYQPKVEEMDAEPTRFEQFKNSTRTWLGLDELTGDQEVHPFGIVRFREQMAMSLPTQVLKQWYQQGDLKIIMMMMAIISIATYVFAGSAMAANGALAALKTITGGSTAQAIAIWTTGATTGALLSNSILNFVGFGIGKLLHALGAPKSGRITNILVSQLGFKIIEQSAQYFRARPGENVLSYSTRLLSSIFISPAMRSAQTVLTAAQAFAYLTMGHIIMRSGTLLTQPAFRTLTGQAAFIFVARFIMNGVENSLVRRGYGSDTHPNLFRGTFLARSMAYLSIVPSLLNNLATDSGFAMMRSLASLTRNASHNVYRFGVGNFSNILLWASGVHLMLLVVGSTLPKIGINLTEEDNPILHRLFAVNRLAILGLRDLVGLPFNVMSTQALRFWNSDLMNFPVDAILGRDTLTEGADDNTFDDEHEEYNQDCDRGLAPIKAALQRGNGSRGLIIAQADQQRTLRKILPPLPGYIATKIVAECRSTQLSQQAETTFARMGLVHNFDLNLGSIINGGRLEQSDDELRPVFYKDKEAGYSRGGEFEYALRPPKPRKDSTITNDGDVEDLITDPNWLPGCPEFSDDESDFEQDTKQSRAQEKLALTAFNKMASERDLKHSTHRQMSSQAYGAQTPVAYGSASTSSTGSFSLDDLLRAADSAGGQPGPAKSALHPARSREERALPYSRKKKAQGKKTGTSKEMEVDMPARAIAMEVEKEPKSTTLIGEKRQKRDKTNQPQERRSKKIRTKSPAQIAAETEVPERSTRRRSSRRGKGRS